MENKNLERDRFMFYLSWKEQFDLLPTDEMKIKLLYGIIDYHMNKNVEFDETILKMAWSGMKYGIDSNIKKYNIRVNQNRDNGKYGYLGGRPKKTSNSDDENPKNPKNPRGLKKTLIDDKCKMINDKMNASGPDILEEKEINKEKESGDESPVDSRILDTPRKKFEKMENKPDQNAGPYPGEIDEIPTKEVSFISDTHRSPDNNKSSTKNEIHMSTFTFKKRKYRDYLEHISQFFDPLERDEKNDLFKKFEKDLENGYEFTNGDKTEEEVIKFIKLYTKFKIEKYLELKEN